MRVEKVEPINNRKTKEEPKKKGFSDAELFKIILKKELTKQK